MEKIPPPPPFDVPDLASPAPQLPGPRRVPWDKLPGESDLDYARFQHYARSEGSVKASAKALGVSYEHVRRISAANRWKARREALRVEERAEQRALLKNQTERHASAMFEAWRTVLDMSIESLAHHRALGTFLSLKETTLALKRTTEALRLLDGQTTSNLGLSLEGADLDKLDKLAKMLDSLEEESNAK